MIWSLLSTILAIESKSHSDTLLIDKSESISVLVNGRNIYSKNCKEIKNCFIVPTELSFYSNQNILFSLCYQSEGIPKFATLKKSKKKVQVCTKGKSVVELDELMTYYKSMKSS